MAPRQFRTGRTTAEQPMQRARLDLGECASAPADCGEATFYPCGLAHSIVYGTAEERAPWIAVRRAAWQENRGTGRFTRCDAARCPCSTPPLRCDLDARQHFAHFTALRAVSTPAIGHVSRWRLRELGETPGADRLRAVAQKTEDHFSRERHGRPSPSRAPSPSREMIPPSFVEGS